MAIFRKKKQEVYDPFRRGKKKKNAVAQKLEDLEKAVVFLNKVNYNISMNDLKMLSIILTGLGLLIGALLKNVYLSLLMAIAAPLVLMEFVLIKKEDIAMKMDMMIIKYSELIKNTYLSTHSIKDSVSQNMHRFKEPVRTLFREMVEEIEIFNVYPEDALKHMVIKFESPALEKLVNQLILCNRDQRFDSSLSALTLQLNDRRQFLQKWQFISKDVISKFTFMLALVNGLVLFTFLSYKEMGEAFLASGSSKVIIAIYVAIQLFALFSTLRKVNQVKV